MTTDEVKPLDMLLFCPMCGEQHIDSVQLEKDWANPPHRSHECQFCGHVWRPADVPTNGVLKITTKGKRDGTARPRGFFTDLDTEPRRLPTSTEARAFKDVEPLVLWEEGGEVQCEAEICQGEVEFTNTGLTLDHAKARALRDWLDAALAAAQGEKCPNTGVQLPYCSCHLHAPRDTP